MSVNTTHNQIYNYRGPHDARSQQRHLDNLYAMLGLRPSTTYKTTRDLITNVESSHDVALRLAYAAYDTDNPAKLVKDAVRELQEAQAREALKDAFLKAEATAATTTIRALVDQGVEDAREAFEKDVQALTEAAGHLDPDHPLDAEAAVARDAGVHLTTARGVLARLGTYASIHTHVGANTGAPANLCKLLPILGLPEIVQQEVYRSVTESTRTANPNDIKGTLTVRELGRDAQYGIDDAIIGIARGDYDGVTFRLGTQGEVSRNGSAMRTVHTQKVVFDKRASFGL